MAAGGGPALTGHPPLDAELVEGLIAQQFPRWAHLPIRPVEPGGWDNRTFRLGDDMSVRLPSGEAYAAQVDKEQRWLPVLAPRLPLPVPVPLARGEPGLGYPYPWSVRRWLEGEPASEAEVGDLSAFALELAGFLTALGRADATDAPAPGPHNFWRGGPLAVYDGETRQALEALGSRVPRGAALAVWEEALESEWRSRPVWLHGDVAADNLLVRDGRLAAVIDFGGAAAGDPACDLAIAWTFFPGRSRRVFRDALGADAGTWARGRAWALWKALITIAGGDARSAAAARALDQVLAG